MGVCHLRGRQASVRWSMRVQPSPWKLKTKYGSFSAQCAGSCDPFRRLTGYRLNPVVIAVVVQDCEVG